MENIKLNLGCDKFKLQGFTNIDINPEVNPDLVLDLNDLDKKFDPNSVDFIFAGHVLEHLPYANSLNLLKQCSKILKPFRMLMVVVPDYTKCMDLDIEMAEKVIMAQGDHKALFNRDRLYKMIKESGFRFTFEVTDLKEVPYLLVPNIYDPKPEPWQTCFVAFNIF